MFLIALTPLVPLGGIAIVLGAAYAAYRWLWGAPSPDEKEKKKTVLDDDDDDDDYDDDEDAETGGPNTRCAKTGQSYDLERWSTPIHVAAAIVGMGYMVSPALTTPADVKSIKKLQERFRDDKIGPYANAPKSWIHGRSGPCFLISLSAAEALQLAGQWELRP